jgi:putative aminopeptidase FrvX
MNISLLRELCEARGVPGQEAAIRRIVRRELCQLTDELRVDAMGNLYATFPGESDARIMIAAHMDEIGFIIKYIDEKGFLRLQPLGGFDPRQLFAQRVLVNKIDGSVAPGVLCYSTKPPHLLSKPDDKGPELEQFFVDTGMKVDDVKASFEIGGMVTLDRGFTECGDAFAAKSVDNRVGVFVMIEALRKMPKCQFTVVAVATTQEEIGLRGATTAAFQVQPQIGIALDTTIAADHPGSSVDAQVTSMGGGVGIKIMDGSLISHPLLVQHMRDLARKNNIPHQMEILPRGGTDGGALQRSGPGCAGITLSVPTRYIHTVNEMVHAHDVQAAIDLLALYLGHAQTGQYEGLEI